MEFEEEVVLLVLLHKKNERRQKGSINSGYIPYSIQDRNVACFTLPLTT
jgi:hypothetical protein